MHANKPKMAKKWEKEEESVNESSYHQKQIIDFIKKNKQAVEDDPSNMPRIKLFGVKGDTNYLNISLDALSKLAKIMVKESINEAKARAGDYVKTIFGIAQIEKVRGSIAYMKLPNKKSKDYWMNDLKFLKPTGKMEKGKPLWTESFGGELKEILTEKKELGGAYINQIERLTDRNNHTRARAELARHIGDKRLIKAYEGLMYVEDLLRDANDTSGARSRLDKKLFAQAKKVFSDYDAIKGVF